MELKDVLFHILRGNLSFKTNLFDGKKKTRECFFD